MVYFYLASCCSSMFLHMLNFFKPFSHIQFSLVWAYVFAGGKRPLDNQMLVLHIHVESQELQ
jgi:uncharacterized membrane protein